jgi:ABC-type polar amino acid transport system ATPase subunit
MSDVVLTVDDLHLRRGPRVVLAGVRFSVARGELVAIMGPSGSGKTTVLRVIAGLESYERGRVAVTGRVGMVFQFHYLFEHLTAMQNICLAPVHAHGMSPDDARRRAHDLLSAFGVDHRAEALPRQLSGGEAQRVAIARALAVDPPLLLMDEPTASLDPARRSELGELLRGLLRQNRALLMATHDEDFARTWATRVLRMDNGVLR